MTDRKPAIDLTRHAFKRELGDLALYGTWIHNDDQESAEPALVIVPRYRANGVKPCCIALSAAYKYDEPRYLARAAGHFAKQLGFDTLADAHKLATVIHDHLLDLIKMPVDPKQAIVVGEAQIDIGGGRRRTIEMVDHEPIPQA